MAPIIAERWEDLFPSMKKLNDALSSIPAPPVPDDEFSQRLNQLNRHTEAITEQVRSRAQMQEEADERNAG